MPYPATVYVVDDDASSRKAIVMLARSVHLPVEGFDSAKAFLGAFQCRGPACLVLDIRMPDMSGLELQQALLARGDSPPVIMLTGYGDVPTAVQALRAGAADFVEKPFQDQKLLDTIQLALRRDQDRWLQREREQEVESRLALLTAGERDVLDRMVCGKAYKSIARELDISYKTVQARRAQIMEKMQTSDLPELIALVLYRVDVASDLRVRGPALASR